MATDNNGTLTVRNIEQAGAWLELDGQISDGHWENARPGNHWTPWCSATVVVAKPGGAVGRDFYARRSTYNFTDKRLLDVVGLRMLGIVRIARSCGIDVAQALEHDVDCEDGRIDWNGSEGYTGAYWDQKRVTMAAMDHVAIDAALDDESYTMTDLRRDLKDLKEIIRSYKPQEPVEEPVKTEVVRLRSLPAPEDTSYVDQLFPRAR